MYGYPVTTIFEDRYDETDGTNYSLTYTHKSDNSSHAFKTSQSVSSSDRGSADEINDVTYQFNINHTQRFSTAILINATKIETISGVDGVEIDDRTNCRFEPSLKYKLNRDWSMNARYSYAMVDRENVANESVANALYINFYLYWPKLVGSY